MSEKDLPERLQLQNERIQEIENKIKKLEDKEQDGKYLMSLKEKLVAEEKAKGDIENIYSLSAIEIAEIKAKYTNILCEAYNAGSPEDNIFLGWNDVEGYGGYWTYSQTDDYYISYCFKPDEVGGPTVYLGTEGYFTQSIDGFEEIYTILIQEDPLKELAQFEQEDYDGTPGLYIILSSEPEETVSSPFGDLTVYYVTYGEYHASWEDKEHDYGRYETYEADGRTYEVHRIEYTVIQNLGNKALLTATHDLMPEYEGILSDMIPKLFD